MSAKTKTTSGEAKKGGSLSRSALYAAVSAHSLDAIKTLADIMHNSTNPNARLGASKALLDKALPDLKAMEMSSSEGKPILIKLDVKNGRESI